ncbi:MAG: collagenase [Chloroflexota bacterium]
MKLPLQNIQKNLLITHQSLLRQGIAVLILVVASSLLIAALKPNLQAALAQSEEPTVNSDATYTTFFPLIRTQVVEIEAQGLEPAEAELIPPTEPPLDMAAEQRVYLPIILQPPVYQTFLPIVMDTLPFSARGPEECVNALTATASASKTDQQVEIVTGNADCTVTFVDFVLNRPADHLDAFFELIAHPTATDPLWDVVFERLRLGEFRFGATTVERLLEEMPVAVAACQGGFRCGDWDTYILSQLPIGGFYQCPDTNHPQVDMNSVLLASLPYADYDCTERIVAAMVPIVDAPTTAELITMAESHEDSWSRRNALRVLGRMASEPSFQTQDTTDNAPDNPPSANELVTVVFAQEIVQMLMTRLHHDTDINVLQDVVWLLDSFYYPAFDAQPDLERISKDSVFGTNLRWRTIAAISRLFDAKTTLVQSDIDYLHVMLWTDDVWVRAQAAYTIRYVRESQVDQKQYGSLIFAVRDRWDEETELIAQAAIAQARDHFEGSDYHEQLRLAFVETHLNNSVNEDFMNIASGLAPEELPQFITLMQDTQAVFFDVMGDTFTTPVTGDPTDAMYLLIFAERGVYQAYMDAFVGYGSHAGGLYIERDATLFTYDRTEAESTLTLEHLIAHEFSHYLQGRYIYPGLWTDAGYHTEPLGWADEGLAEFIGFTVVNANEQYEHPLPDTRLNTICASSSYRSLNDLLHRRSGYDEQGIFDYDYGWAFVHYIMTEHQEMARRIYETMRNQTYRVDEFEQIAGVSVVELEASWHAAMVQWCTDYQANP